MSSLGQYPRSDARSPEIQAHAVVQQTEDAHKCGCKPKEHIDENYPCKLCEFDVVVFVKWLLICILDPELAFKPPENSAPDEEYDELPDEGDGDVVI